MNLPLESARGARDRRATADTDALVAAVRSAGYDATVVPPPHAHHGDAHQDMDPYEHALSGHSMAPGPRHGPRRGHLGADRRRAAPTCAPACGSPSVLTVPVLLLSMIPALQFTGWQWVVAALALPVVTWAAWPFHRAAFRAARHGASTMDTLVSIGIIAATGWSLWALLLGGAGELGMTMTPSLWPRAAHEGMTAPELYFEVAAVVTTFLLAGRYAEHRSRRRAGDALRALLDLGAKDVVARWSGRHRAARPGRPAGASATSSSCGPARRSPPTASSSAARPRSTPRCSPVSPCPSTSAPATRSPGRPSTPRAHSSCARRASARRRGWRRSAGSSRPPRPARPPCSGSPTASRRCSSRSCWSSRSARSPPGCSAARAPRRRSPPRSPC